MKSYPKIRTVFKRDPNNNYKTLLPGEYSLPEFEYLQGNKWIFTEKVDGTNIRIGYSPEGNVEFAGRTNRAQIPQHLHEKLCQLFPPEKMQEFFSGAYVCLYGEGFGHKIQKGGGKYLLNDVSFVLFDVLINDWWLKRDDIEGIAKALSINVVPIIGYGDLTDMVGIVKAKLPSNWGNFLAEGIVARPEVDLLARDGERVITKIKHTDFEKE